MNVLLLIVASLGLALGEFREQFPEADKNLLNKPAEKCKEEAKEMLRKCVQSDHKPVPVCVKEVIQFLRQCLSDPSIDETEERIALLLGDPSPLFSTDPKKCKEEAKEMLRKCVQSDHKPVPVCVKEVLQFLRQCLSDPSIDETEEQIVLLLGDPSPLFSADTKKCKEEAKEMLRKCVQSDHKPVPVCVKEVLKFLRQCLSDPSIDETKA